LLPLHFSSVSKMISVKEEALTFCFRDRQELQATVIRDGLEPLLLLLVDMFTIVYLYCFGKILSNPIS
jgi:hypothetical protein